MRWRFAEARKPSFRRVAAEALAQFHWQPSNANQRSLFAIAKDDWDAVVKEGSDAVEPLIAALKVRRIRWRAAEALCRIHDARVVEPVIAELVKGNFGKLERLTITEVVAACIESLTKIAPDMPDGKLRSLCVLPDDRTYYWKKERSVSYLMDSCEEDHPTTMSLMTVRFSRIKQLARQELIRRGIEA
jgi:hypothetical protein